MDRRLLLQILGITPFAVARPVFAQNARNVLIVGAGSAGLTAAYHLQKAGVNVTLLEAASRWGGRVKRLDNFADFPIDLGAEWIHDEPEVLGDIMGQTDTDMGVKTIEYRPKTYQFWHKEKLRNRNLLRVAYAEIKFETTTWYGFFEKFILPEIKDALVLNAPVTEIEYSNAGVTALTKDGRRFDADQILVTVPISILKRNDIRFNPELPPTHIEGLSKISFGNGLKIFMKFGERFYPDILYTGTISDVLSSDWDDKIYYDAAFGKSKESNVLGLFNVAQGELPRANLSDDDLLADVINELDQIFDGSASINLQSAQVQNWSREPFIGGSYSMEVQGDQGPEDLLTSIGGRLHFAGEAMGGDAQATVHGAAFSAIDAVEAILQA